MHGARRQKSFYDSYDKRNPSSINLIIISANFGSNWLPRPFSISPLTIFSTLSEVLPSIQTLFFVKLRSMVVGEKGPRVYIASEEAAIRAMDPEAGNIRYPAGGEPVIVTLNRKEGGEE